MADAEAARQLPEAEGYIVNLDDPVHEDSARFPSGTLAGEESGNRCTGETLENA